MPISPQMADELVFLLALFVFTIVFHLLLKRFFMGWLYKVFCHTKAEWDQILFEQGAFRNLPHLIPALVLYQGSTALPITGSVVGRIMSAWIALIIAAFIDRILTAGLYLYNTYPISNRRPIKGYIQVTKLILYVAAGVTAISLLVEQSPWLFLSGIGAMTAIVTLVFRDTILSFVASIQLMGNDLIRVGDWIEMSQYGADGDVEEIALHTVKVRNFDNTITTIPTYKLIEDSFRNWRGMIELGGRRIRRSILIDQTSVSFCDSAMIASFERIHVLKDYVCEKRDELAHFNQVHNIDTSVSVNGRRMTNLGTFRAYLEGYLRQHPKIRQDMTFLVRQLEPTPEGLPLEIYVFTTDTAWVKHEGVQADIFDHILAVLPEFGLRVAQNPTGNDLTSLADGRENLRAAH